MDDAGNGQGKRDNDEKHYGFFKEYRTSTIYHFYISRPIGEPKHYIELIHVIKNAQESDIIYVHLNTPGGQIRTGSQILSAIKASKAHVVTCAEGEIASLGTLLFLAGDEFIVHDDCHFMFHNYSGGTCGKGHEQIAWVTAEADYMRNLTKRMYIPFLSEEEFEDLIKGQDIWMQADEVRERLDKMINEIKKNKKDDKKLISNHTKQ